jgi:hypothetical protein
LGEFRYQSLPADHRLQRLSGYIWPGGDPCELVEDAAVPANVLRFQLTCMRNWDLKSVDLQRRRMG